MPDYLNDFARCAAFDCTIKSICARYDAYIQDAPLAVRPYIHVPIDERNDSCRSHTPLEVNDVVKT